MKRFEVKFTRPTSSSVHVLLITASSASQAKEQIKSRFNGAVKIISAVEK